MKGQLTGVPRQLKDSVADIYNNIKKWKQLNSLGFEQLTRLSDIKLLLIVPLKNENTMSKKEPVSRYSLELDLVCRELVQTLKKMELISQEFSAILHKFEKLTELASFNSSLGNDSNNVPFSGWPISQFASYVADISNMFSKELSVKHCIVESAAHVDHGKQSGDVAKLSEECRNVLTTYSSCWLHEPYINDSVIDLLVEGLLFETGHST